MAVVGLDTLGVEDPVVPPDVLEVQREWLCAAAKLVALRTAGVSDGGVVRSGSLKRTPSSSIGGAMTDFQNSLKLR